MQLKKDKARRIGGQLAAATTALLGAHAGAQDAAADLGPWDVDAAVLYYGESDGRVSDLSFNALLRKEFREDRFVSFNVTLDSLTGASPSGAVPSNVPQTFTRPSGGAAYTVAAGEQPLDTSFLDTRIAAGVALERPLGRLSTVNLGFNFSNEYDYLHTGISAKVSRDFNNRNTTFSAGVAYASDTIDPVGGVPIGFSPMLGEIDDDGDGDDDEDGGDGDDYREGGSSQSKNVTDILLGVSQVINRKTLVQINYSLSQADGYQSDPYKILSVVDPATGWLVPGPAGSDLYLYLFEQRPDTRDKNSLYTLLKRDVGGNVLDLSYRYMTDDWGIDSHTVDMRFRWNLDSGRYIEPHVRFYQQTAADFYRTVLLDGQPLPQYASADYRLAEFDGITLGVEFGRPARRGQMSTRLELYQQAGQPDPAARFGILSDYDLYPDLSAVIAQFSYKFGR